MARIKRAVNAHKGHKKVLKLAKGYWGAKSKLYRPANQAVMKSLQYAYIGRKLRKRDMRRLWIVRINAAARMEGISYSRFMNGLKLNDITPVSYTHLIEAFDCLAGTKNCDAPKAYP